MQTPEEMGCVSDLSTIHNCTFVGSVYLGTSQGFISFRDDLTLPAGLTQTTFHNCYLFPGIRVAQNTLIENTVILPGSIVMGCGRISCKSSNRNPNNM